MFKRILIGLSAAMVLAGPALAQTTPSSVAVRAHMTFLADDLLEGRGTGTRGHEVASLYVITRLQALGVQPMGNAEGTDWRQPVAFSTTRVADGGITWTPTGGQATTWANGTQALMIPVVAGQSSMSGDVVFVGYGLDADYAGLDVAGKIVLALMGAPEGVEDEGKQRAAFSRGAIGMIQINTLASQEDYEWSDLVGYLTSEQVSLREPNGGLLPRGPQFALMDREAATLLFSGAPRSLEQVLAEAATTGGRPQGFALPGRATLSTNITVGEMESHNVVGVLPGSDPALRGEYVVVVAHLDHEGISPDESKPDRIFNGAMDNAMGTAAMLETARILSEQPVRPRRSVIFLAVTGEEKGLLGSSWFAQHPTVPKESLAGVVNLDMPVLLWDFSDIVVLGAEHSTMGPVVERVATGMGLVTTPDPLPEENFFVRSDHYSFVQQGVPAVDISPGPANGGKAILERFLEDTYHEVNDDMNQAFDWDAVDRFVQLNAGVVRAVADADQRPLWYEGDEFGTRHAPNAPKAPKPAE